MSKNTEKLKDDALFLMGQLLEQKEHSLKTLETINSLLAFPITDDKLNQIDKIINS